MTYANINKPEVLAGNFKNIRRLLKNAASWASFERKSVLALQKEIFLGVEVDNYTPGVFRPASPPGELNISIRSLACKPSEIYSMRSFMNEKALNKFDEALSSLAPPKLKGLSTQEISKIISTAYAILDYTHPFWDGNSRTFRTLTRLVAYNVGFDLNWDRIAASEFLRDELYCARSLEANALALEDPDQEVFKESIENMLEDLQDKRNLNDLLLSEKLITPLRALDFKDEVQICLNLADDDPLAFKAYFAQSCERLSEDYPESHFALATMQQVIAHTIKDHQDLKGYEKAVKVILPVFYGLLAKGTQEITLKHIKSALQGKI